MEKDEDACDHLLRFFPVPIRTLFAPFVCVFAQRRPMPVRYGCT